MERETMFNPVPGFFPFEGSYTVELVPDIVKDYVEKYMPENAKANGNTVSVIDGKIRYSEDGIHFCYDPDGNKYFCVGFKKILTIKDNEGRVIWQNPDHED